MLSGRDGYKLAVTEWREDINFSNIKLNKVRLRHENGRIATDLTKRDKTDQSLKGIKKLYKEDPNRAEKEADEIIKNTYRTLMTRGMKGCYVYCTDQHLSSYLKKCLGMQKKREQDDKGND